MANVFLSYAREDQAQLEPLVSWLEASGISVFWDRNVPPGSSWRQVLDRELSAARCVVVAWSKHSVGSEWVLEEAEEGKLTRRLVPVLLDATGTPIGFRTIQAVDLSGWIGGPEHDGVKGLVLALRHRLELGSRVDGEDKSNAPIESDTSEANPLAQIRTQMIRARSPRELQRVLYELEAHLTRNPYSAEARELKDQIERALQPRLNRSSRRILGPASIGLGLAAAVALWFAISHSTSHVSSTALPSVSNTVAPVASPLGSPLPSPSASAIEALLPNYRRVYYETFESLESLAPSVWPLGRKGDWKGELSNRQYRLCNASGAATASFTSTLHYSEGASEPVDQSDSRITMTVSLEPRAAKYAAAGILFRHSKERDAYSAFALGSGHSVMFIQARDGHLKIVSTWTLDGIKDGDPVPLRVEGHGNELRLFVNAKRIDVVPDPGGSGDPGVFAMGNGCARFDDVSMALPVK